MVEVPITIACGNYDRTAAIRDGRVKVDGCVVTYLPLYPEEIFHRAFKFREFDVSELSFSSYLRTVAAGASPYIDRKSTRLNSSHLVISYAVFCLKKKITNTIGHGVSLESPSVTGLVHL